MSRFNHIIALAATLASLTAQAAPAPALSQTGLSQSSSNAVGGVPGQSAYLNGQRNEAHDFSTTSTVIDRAVNKTYVIENYKDTTTTTTWTNTNYYVDKFYNSFGGGSIGVDGSKWMQLSGTIHSTQSTTLDFSLSAYGSFLSTMVPGIGSINPAFPTLLVGFNGAALSAVAASTTATSSGYYSVDGNFGREIEAGGSLSFSALVYAGNNVSLGGFSVNFSGDHDITNQPRSFTTNSTAFVSTTPVPEPETYAMLMAGLGMFGFMSRRQKGNIRALTVQGS